MKTNISFTDQFRHALTTCGETLHSIAKKTGIHESVLYRMASGERFPRPAALDRLAEYLGLSIVVQSPSSPPPKPGRKLRQRKSRRQTP